MFDPRKGNLFLPPGGEVLIGVGARSQEVKHPYFFKDFKLLSEDYLVSELTKNKFISNSKRRFK